MRPIQLTPDFGNARAGRQLETEKPYSPRIAYIRAEQELEEAR